jgi:predicted alpha/beta superfamily hydrolase
MRRTLLLLVAFLVVGSPATAQVPLNLGEVFALASKVLGEERKVVVWTPPDYASSARRYPVLYLTDAERQFGHSVTTIEFLSRNGRMPAAIVVGIFNVARTRDLTPYTANEPDVDRRLPAAGGADKFLNFVETELVPWVEQQYRVEPFRMFAGHSFGGLFAVHALATKPDLFNVVIAVSPTLYWRQMEPVKRLTSLVESRPDLNRTLYVTLGTEGAEMQSGFDKLKAAFEKKAPAGLHWHMVQMPAEDHGSIVLRSHYDALEKTFDGWQLPLTGGRYEGGLTAVEAHYEKLSARLGWKAAPPEQIINVLGYAEMAAGRMEDALAYFEYNVRTYPGSANVHDSLGEGLEAAGRLDEALAKYDEAIRRAEASGDTLLDAFIQHRDALRKKIAAKQ